MFTLLIVFVILQTMSLAGARTMPLKNRFVYVIGPKDGPQKIGIATSPQKRLLTFQTASSLKLDINFIITLPENEAAKVERHAHWILRKKKALGEWFSVHPDEAREAVEHAAAAVREGTDQHERSFANTASPPAPMTADDFRAALKRLGLTQVGFARVVAELSGQPMPLRTVQRWAADQQLPAPVVALVVLMERVQPTMPVRPF